MLPFSGFPFILADFFMFSVGWGAFTKRSLLICRSHSLRETLPTNIMFFCCRLVVLWFITCYIWTQLTCNNSRMAIYSNESTVLRVSCRRMSTLASLVWLRYVINHCHVYDCRKWGYCSRAAEHLWYRICTTSTNCNTASQRNSVYTVDVKQQ